MIKYLFRHNKDYSRFNIIKELLKDLELKNDIYILLPFSKNQFFKNFLKRDRIINDFFISNYDTYVFDRKKISKKNPRAWWKYFQDWFNFKFSKYLISDTMSHLRYWETLFGKFKGKHFVLPVLADTSIYYPAEKEINNEKIKILFYGSFIPLHGIDVILNTFSLMEKNNIEFEANIIGKGQMYSEMKKLHHDLNLKQVSMNGEVINEKQLSDMIREHDIVLGIFGESEKAKSVIPNKVYQSTACKKCTVTMTADVLKEFYNVEDLVTCDNNPESLANVLTDLINNREKVNIIGQNAYNQFQNIYIKTQNDFLKFIKVIERDLR
jgi:glycosyltransferase involved in cell wall biosynthesis